MKHLLLSTVVGLALAASSALAQTYTESGDKDNLTTARGRLDNGTAVTNQAVYHNDATVWSGYKCGTLVSVTMLYKLSDGTVVQSRALACDTTQRWVSDTAPLAFELVAASPTTAVSTTAGGVSITHVQTREEERTMARIKMTRNKHGSPDGHSVLHYQAGEEYDVPEALAVLFVEHDKVAERVAEKAKAIDEAPKNKAVEKAPKNKAA